MNFCLVGHPALNILLWQPELANTVVLLADTHLSCTGTGADVTIRGIRKRLYGEGEIIRRAKAWVLILPLFLWVVFGAGEVPTAMWQVCPS